MCMPIKSRVVKARLVLTARASFSSTCSTGAEFTKPVVGCNTMVCTDARRDLSFSCLVAGPWGSPVVSAPPYPLGPLIRMCSECAAGAHESTLVGRRLGRRKQLWGS